MSTSTIRRCTVLTVLAGTIYVIWLLAGWGGPGVTRVVSNVTFGVFAVWAVVASGIAARSVTGRRRLALTCLSLGVAAWLFAHLVKVGYRVWRHAGLSFPSIVDVGYLLLPIGVCAALVLLPVRQSGQSALRMVLDGVIVAGSVLQVSWVLVLRRVVLDGDVDGSLVGASMVYPLVDVVTVTVGVLILTRARAGERAPVALMLTGVVLMAVANDALLHVIVDHGYDRGQRLDVGWALSLLCFAMAGLSSIGKQPGLPVRNEVPARLMLWLPYVPLAAAGVIGTQYLFDANSAFVLLTACGLVVAVLVRQLLVLAENRRLLRLVADQAVRDPLTGLANRVLFNDRLVHAMGLRERDPRPLAVASIDLDHFKLVNDSLGHPAGDELLIRVAERLGSALRTGDTVARLGGDEFAVLVEDGPEPPENVAQRIAEVFDEPFVIGGIDVLVRPSIGLAVARSPDDTPASLLKQADIAMYSAKRARSSAIRTFDASMHLSDVDDSELPIADGQSGDHSGTGPLRLLGQLRTAIDHRDLTLVYQPQFDLAGGAVVGVEALVRWPHPSGELLTPDRFLPLVRQNGLMPALTEVVLAKAFADAAAWRARGFAVPVAVNVSAPAVEDRDLPARMSALMSSHGLPANMITLELTEDTVIGDVDVTRQVLRSLRELGIRISIDDFGSAYSALHYLREFPIDEVKLDRLFVAPIVDGPRSAAIVESVIGLAHALDVRLIAEGVEDAETAALLRRFGCDAAQGYFYSRPVPADELPAVFAASAAGAEHSPAQP